MHNQEESIDCIGFTNKWTDRLHIKLITQAILGDSLGKESAIEIR